MTTPRVVVVIRPTEYDELLARHGTRGQVDFFLRSRGQDVVEVLDRHARTAAALEAVRAAMPIEWRSATVKRAELARFVFEPADVVVILGQDGLVANVAKYLQGQPVIGVDPLPARNAGVLVPHQPQAVPDLLADVVAGRAAFVHRTMAQVITDDGQRLDALNEIYVGHEGHQSARYVLAADGARERQSSSGILIGTGTGATGWCASIGRVLAPQLPLPHPDERALSWFVREAWPSRSTRTTLVAGRLEGESGLALTSESEQLVAFGDGMESDRLLLGWGQQVTVEVSPLVLRTVI